MVQYTSNKNSAIRLVIFDLAGTTVKDNGQVAAAFTTALAQYNIHITAEQLSSVRGSSKRQVVLNFIPDVADRMQIAQGIYDAFHEDLKRRYASEGIEPIEGAADVFRSLRDPGIKIAFTTGFDRDIARLLIDALDWQEITDAVVCAEEVREGRPAPYMIFRAIEATGISSVQEVATVGDTALDLRAGYNAGVAMNVGVLSGAHSREILEREPHTHILSSIADLSNILRR
jgi:phosphonatase-like hydrolase